MTLVKVNEHPTRADELSPHEEPLTKNVPSQTTLAAETRPATASPDLWSAAYREAVDSLGADIRGAVVLGSNAAQLFSELEELDKDVSRDSAFLRGVARLRSIQVPLETFKLALDLASPLASLDPAANACFGVVRGVTAVRVFNAVSDVS